MCAPKTPFDGVICVSKTGDLACPNATYSEKHVYYKGVNDTRSCSPCDCDHDCDYAWRVEAAGASCSAPFSLDESDSCVMVSPTDGKINVGVQISGHRIVRRDRRPTDRQRGADRTGHGVLPAVALEADRNDIINVYLDVDPYKANVGNRAIARCSARSNVGPAIVSACCMSNPPLWFAAS